MKDSTKDYISVIAFILNFIGLVMLSTSNVGSRDCMV